MCIQIHRLSHRVEADESSDLVCYSLDRVVESKARVPRSHVERKRAAKGINRAKEVPPCRVPVLENKGAAKDGSVKTFIVARVIFERRKPKKACCCAATRTRADPGQGPSPTHKHMRSATSRGLPPTAPIPTPPKVSSSLRALFPTAPPFRGQKKKRYAAARGDPDASPPTPALR